MKQRYFIRLSYKGTNFSGWQRQNNAHTVQEEIEDACELLFKEKINIIGCGRTDSGVHARNFIAHFDLPEALDFDLVFKLNHIVSQDITIHEVFPVDVTAHSRFDATKRTYDYFIKGEKDCFHSDYAFAYPMIHKLDIGVMNLVASLLMEYDDFYTFCKSKTDVKTTICKIYLCQWQWEEEDKLRFTISANRFLRGMVRLIVGMCINVSLGKLEFEEVKDALENKRRLKRDWSVYAQGLILSDIAYPYPVSLKHSVITVEEGTAELAYQTSILIPELKDPYQPQEYINRLKDVDHIILIAKKGSELVGFKVGYKRSEDGSFYSWMGGVLPAFRRLGVANKLAQVQEEWAIAKGYSSIQMKTRFRLKGMQKFAIKRGFHILSIENRDPLSESVIWLEKKILTE